MSLEQIIQDNTAALTRVADLLEISNASREKLIAQAGGTSAPTSTPTPASDGGMTVAEIKEATKEADKSTLEEMLAAEKDGKARTSAISAIEAAIAALETDAGKSAETDTPAADTNEASADETSTSAAPAASDDKNAQPVPAEVSGEQAAKAFAGWFGETDDEAERAKRRGFVEQIVSTLGAKVSELDPEGRRKAIFFLRRRRAEIEVDFGAAYDFNGSPTQDAPAAASSQDDDLL